MVFTLRLHATGSGGTKSTVKLSDLNPKNVKVINHSSGSLANIYLNTTDDREVVEGIALRTGKPYKSKSIDVRFLCVEQRTASQVAKAFVHLIKLCGGKGELFE
jgi:hypothetical protein